MSSSVDQIKSKIDIVSLISSYIKLDKAGSNFKGRCPFHNEKTPSFFVSPDRGSYYCFGCQAKGDIFTFVQEFEGLDFVGSLKVLAERAGVTLEQYHTGEKTEKQHLHSILEQAVFFYEKNLSEYKPAMDYLHSRGVTDTTIKSFRIGYAPHAWRDLYEYLLSKGVTAKDMLLVGLIKKKDGLPAQSGTTDSYYDTFRGRIMFPINDSSGRVVGFSGRILVADDPGSRAEHATGQVNQPKYVNSPQTVLFNKSEILFGLDKAKKDIRLKDYSILVEGQMDLIMLHQVGITNTVASSGTALTESHLVKLNRLSNRIIMSYDGDSAGFSASNRSSQLAIALGMDLKLAVMPEGKDPADLAKDDVDKLKDCLRHSKHIIDFYVDSLLLRNMEPRKLGQEIRKHVLPFVALLTSKIDQAHFIKSIAKKTFIKEEALWDDLKLVAVNNPDLPQNNTEASPPIKRQEAIERRVLGVIMWQKDNKNGIKDIDVADIESRAQRILGARMNELIEEHKPQIDSLIFETESYYNGKTDLKKDIDSLLLSLEEEYLKQRFSKAMINLQKAEQSKNSQEISKYLEECQEISQQINKIKNNYEK